ncbi:MAG: hypothetical protein AB7S38_41090 [Vulcanimicrobiota bacterium]
MTLQDLIGALRRWKLVLVLVFVLSFIPLYKMAKKKGPQQGPTTYVSTAKLMVRPERGDLIVMGDQTGPDAGASQTTDLWFQDFDQVREILREPSFASGVMEHLPTKIQGLDADSLAGRMAVYPRSVSLDQVSLMQEQAKEQGAALLDSKFEQVEGPMGAPIKRETSLWVWLVNQEAADPYTFEVDDYRAGVTQQKRMLEMIVLTSMAQTPEDAKSQLIGIVAQFLDEARKRVSKEFTQRRVTIEGLVEDARKRSERAEKLLRGLPAEEPELLGEVNRLQSEVARYQSELRLVEAEADAIADYMREGGELPGNVSSQAVNLMAREVSQRVVELAALEDTFTPESRRVQDAKRHLARLKELEMATARSSAESLLGEKETHAEALRINISSSSNELEAARARLHALMQVTRDRSQLLREAQIWHTNYLNLMGKLYVARIEEQQSLEKGTLFVLEEPHDGVLLQTPQAVAAPVWKALSVVPLCMLLSVGAVVVIEALRKYFDFSARVENMLDTQVIIEMPALPRRFVRDWDIKKKMATRSPSALEGAGEE